MTNTTLPAETLSDSDLAQQMLAWAQKIGSTRQVQSFMSHFHLSYPHAKRILDDLAAQGKIRSIASGRNRQYGFLDLPTVREQIYQFKPLKPVDQITRERLQEIAEHRRLYPSKHL